MTEIWLRVLSIYEAPVAPKTRSADAHRAVRTSWTRIWTTGVSSGMFGLKGLTFSTETYTFLT